MRITHGRTLWPVVALVALVGLTLASPAPAQPAPEIAPMSALGSQVAWSPRVASYDRLVLRISGGDYFVEQEFEAGVAPVFTPVDAEGYQLPDGIYTWELSVIPHAADLALAHFKSQEMSADGRMMKAAEAPAGLTQSGSFTIVGGSIADPNLLEAETGSVAGVELTVRGPEVDDSDAANQ